MMCLWIVRQALPWSRMNDTWLRAAVQFLRPDARLYGRRWAAEETKRLNLSMKNVVFEELKVCSLYYIFVMRSLNTLTN